MTSKYILSKQSLFKLFYIFLLFTQYTCLTHQTHTPIHKETSPLYSKGVIQTGPTTIHLANIDPQTSNLQSDPANVDQELTDPNHIVNPPEFDVFFFISILLLGALLISVLVGTLYRREKIQPSPPNFIKKDSFKNTLEIVYEVSEENLSDSSSGGFASINPRHYSISTEPFLHNTRPLGPKDKVLQVLKCFNLADNWKLLTSPREDMDDLIVFDGIKALGIFWIICGLTFSINANQKDSEVYQKFMKESWWASIAASSVLAADIFFYLSGFFAGFVLLSKFQSYSSNIRNYALVLLHRLARLWPTYLVVIMIFWKIMPFLGGGPLWHQYLNLAGQCTEIFWKNLLFLDNILNQDNDSCFGWGWYLASSVQMFLISLVVCWTYNMNSRIGKVLTGIIILGGLVTTLNFAFGTEEFFAFPLETHMSSFYDFYFNTFVHIAPYFLGMFMGILYKEHKQGRMNIYNSLQENRRLLWVTILLGTILMTVMVLFPGALQAENSKSEAFTNIWIAFNGFLYVCGFALLTIVWLAGEMKWFTKGLRTKCLRIYGRLSYGTYLLSFVVLQVIERTKEDLERFSVSNRLWTTVMVIFITGLTAICLSLIVEIPFMKIEELIQEKLQTRKRSENSTKVSVGEVQPIVFL